MSAKCDQVVETEFLPASEPLGDNTDIVFVNARGTRGDREPELDAFLSYLRDDRLIQSDYVREVDEAVRSFRGNPLWRRYRVFWSERYRDDFVLARRQGRVEGAEHKMAQLASLSEHLERDGRADELSRALREPAFLQRLLEEYGLAEEGTERTATKG